MTDERLSAPPGWSEADYDSNRPDVRQAKQPVVFERDDGDLAVFVRPDDPGDAVEWRVEVAEGGRENLVDAEVVAHDVDDRAEGIHRAREYIEDLASDA